MYAKVIINIVLLFVQRWLEMDKEKRAKKKELLKEAGDAFKEKDKKTRASRLNAVVDKSNKL